MKLRKFKFAVKYIQEWHKIYQILFAISTNVMYVDTSEIWREG